MTNLLWELMALEASDYTPKKDLEWIASATMKLSTLIKNIDSKRYSYVKIINRAGADSYSRSLQLLLPQAKTDDLGIYVIHVCDCGELSHLFYSHRSH